MPRESDIMPLRHICLTTVVQALRSPALRARGDRSGGSAWQALKPGGADVAVTNENKLQYVHLAADWHLRSRLGAPVHAFAEGLSQVSAPGADGARRSAKVIGEPVEQSS